MLSTIFTRAILATSASARHAPVSRRGPVPGGIVDPGAHPSCTLWQENVEGSIECPMIPYFYNVTPEQLLSWVRG
jgi:hypothetical protein